MPYPHVTAVRPRFRSVARFGLLVGPGAGVAVVQIPAGEFPSGYYELEAFWGNRQAAGLAPLDVSDLVNWQYVRGGITVDLVSLGESPCHMRAYGDFGNGDEIAIRTKAQATSNVIYAAGLVVTRMI